MAKYRKRPVVIDAWPYTDSDRCRSALVSEGADIFWDNPQGVGGWFIRTMEGAYRLTEDHVVIRGVAGEFYPCDRDIFTNTYEWVDG